MPSGAAAARRARALARGKQRLEDRPLPARGRGAKGAHALPSWYLPMAGHALLFALLAAAALLGISDPLLGAPPGRGLRLRRAGGRRAHGRRRAARKPQSGTLRADAQEGGGGMNPVKRGARLAICIAGAAGIGPAGAAARAALGGQRRMERHPRKPSAPGRGGPSLRAGLRGAVCRLGPRGLQAAGARTKSCGRSSSC